MQPHRFHSAVDPAHDQAFRRWQREHRDAFYINEKTGTKGMLHRTDCLHLGSGDVDDPRWRPTTSPKHCHASSRFLRDWARRKGMELEDCSTCKPPR